MFLGENFMRIRMAVLEAGTAIMEIYHSGDFDAEKKSDDSPVTRADRAADAIIFDHLSKIFPNEHIITEEQAASHTQKATRFFIVDPLDGTKEFLRKGNDFTVNIGFVDQGVPVFGIVYAPAQERLFYTYDGKAYEELGPFDLDKIATRKEIRVRDADNTALGIVASKSHRDQATDDYIARYAISTFSSAGSSLKFCLVATGEADFYPRLGPTMEWDTAAADAVVRQAGGEVLDFETQKPLLYGKPSYRNGFFLVKSPKVELK